MARINDDIASELSELRTMVLGAQIFLGFQYEAVFMPRFAEAAAANGELALIGLGGLVATVIVLVAPTSHHRLAERGEATTAQSRFAGASLCIGAFLFALSLGADTAFAVGVIVPDVIPIAVLTSLAALIAWFGVEFAMRRHKPRRETPKEELVSLKDQVGQLMSEGRIVLPGVQALLGFQLAAYLSDGFAKLSSAAQKTHDAGLALLLASMILLMAPAPFHRIADHGEPSKRTAVFGVWMIMSGLGCLALALAADLSVATEAITHDAERARTVGIIAAIAALAIWFAYPLWKRRARHGPRSDQAAAQS
jgi:hypothetical protein